MSEQNNEANQANQANQAQDDWEAGFEAPRTCSLNPEECESCQ